MRRLALRRASSLTRWATLLLYVAIIVVLAVATWVEHRWGTAVAERQVYHAAWFVALWAALSGAIVAAICIKRLWRRPAVLLIHTSFLVILAGALTTHLFGRQGHVHLVQGVPVDRFTETATGLTVPLPFTLTLDSFRVVHYPGTDRAADYESYLRGMSRPVSMNRILRRGGYRFYQSSFDEDYRGSWLSVNHDAVGTPLTYAGYTLLALGMLWLLLSPRGRFRRLLRNPSLRQGLWGAVVLCALMGEGLRAQNPETPVIKRELADSLARLQVIYHDRVVPLDTPARDFLLKLYGESSYHGVTPVQVLYSWLFRAQDWEQEPIIEVDNDELRRMLYLEGNHASLRDLFVGSTYRLQTLLDRLRASDGPKSALEKAILRVDERVGVIMMLYKKQLFTTPPEDGSVRPLSDVRIDAELAYNRIPFTRILFIGCLSTGAVYLLWILSIFTGRQSFPTKSLRRHRQRVAGFFYAVTWAALMGMVILYGLRWYIGGHVPLSNGYETMLSLSLLFLLCAAIGGRRVPLLVPFGLILSGFTLLVARLSEMDPEITPLMPVLSSPLLTIHVSVIMTAYALLAFLWLNGLFGLCVGRLAERLALLSRLMLYPATFLLGLGILLGAVWANVSWGRYWAWDPKEVWALVAFMVYALPLHAESFPLLRHPRAFHLYMVAAFAVVLMTYFGVNYLLTGMHSYAGN